MAEKRPSIWPLIVLPVLMIGAVALSGRGRVGGVADLVGVEAVGSASAAPLHGSAPAAASSAPAAAGGANVGVEGPVVLDVSPTGDRRPLSPRIRVTFDRAVPPSDRAKVSATIALDPHVPMTSEWSDDDTLDLLPDRLHPATRYRVVLPGVEPTTWTFRTLFPKAARVTPGEGGAAVLSFDDGAHNRREAVRLYETLDRLGVKAMLFPSGKWAKANEDLLARMAQNGHLVCNHTTNHVALVNLSEAEIEQEIIGGAGHGTCNLMRPPMMAMSERVEGVAARLGYKTFLWDIDTRDWEGLPAEDIVNLVMTRVFPGAVILLHHHGAHTLEAVPTLVTELRANGYEVAWPQKDGKLDLSKLGPGSFRTAAEIARGPRPDASKSPP